MVCLETYCCIATIISQANAKEIEAKLDNGLIKGHAYSITDVKNVCNYNMAV